MIHKQNTKKFTIFFTFISSLLITGFLSLRLFYFDSFLFIIIENVSTIIILIIAILAGMLFKTKKDTIFLFIFLIFITSGLFELLEVLIMENYSSSLSSSHLNSILTFNWNIEKNFISVLLLFSYYSWKLDLIHENIKRKLEIYIIITVVSFTIGIVLIMYLFPSSFLLLSEQVLIIYLLSIISSFILLFTVIQYYRKEFWKENEFEFWFILAIIINFSINLFIIQEGLFLIQLIILLSYILILVGLIKQLNLILRETEIDSLMIKMREEQIADMNEELKEINNDLSEFAYIVSHDLKAPLRGIFQLLKLFERTKSVVDEKGKKYLTQISDRTVHMDNLINDLLAYSKYGRKKPEHSDINLNALIKNIVSIVNPPDHIKIEFDSDFPNIMYDEVRLTQLFQNLLDNAIKFNDKDKGLIEINWKEEEKFYLFSVKDNGQGIDLKYQSIIFDIFEKLPSKNDSSNSTGIGLYLVKKIVEQSGGKIWIKSVLGEGSEFNFTIKK